MLARVLGISLAVLTRSTRHADVELTDGNQLKAKTNRSWLFDAVGKVSASISDTSEHKKIPKPPRRGLRDCR